MRIADEGGAGGMKKLRVLYVDASVGFGGAIISLGLLLRIVANEHTRILTSQPMHIVRASLPGLRVGRLRPLMHYRTMRNIRQAFPGAPRVIRWTLGKLVSVLDVLTTIKNTIRLVFLLKVHRMDLVHLNNGFLPFEAIYAARLAGVPVIVHLRDFGVGRAAGITPRIASAISGVIGVSEAVAQVARDHPLIRCPVIGVHDSVDAAVMDDAAPLRDALRAQLGLSPEHIAVSIFGRVVAWKGQKEFVEAALLAMRQDDRIRAVIVGDASDADEHYFANIREQVRASGRESSFIFTGYQAVVEPYYAASDIVVHASITPEPFGRVVPEAMAALRPIIAMNAGGPPEVITQGVDGLLVEPGDVPGLAAAILQLSGDPALRERMSVNGRRYVEQHLGLEPYAVKIMAFFEEVIRRSGRNR